MNRDEEVSTLRRCPVCACPIEEDSPEDPVFECPRCSTPHHEDCWEFNGGCAVYACRDAEPPAEVEMESWPQVLQDYRSWLQVTRLSRRATLVFILSCLISAHLALLGGFTGFGGVYVLLSLLPMALSGTAFVLLEKRSMILKESLAEKTGDEPFQEQVSAREAARWLNSARHEVGDLDGSASLKYFWMLLVAVALLLPIAATLPLRALAFLGAFDAFVLYMVKDSFLSMRREQSILIERFKSSFQPRLTEGKKGKSPDDHLEEFPSLE